MCCWENAQFAKCKELLYVFLFLCVFYEYMHIDCTMHNEEYHLIFWFVLPKFKIGDRIELELGHKGAASWLICWWS